MVEQNKIVTQNWIEGYTSTFVRRPNSHILAPGKYIFGPDLPLGAYLLRIVRGAGKIETFWKREKGEDEDVRGYAYIGLSVDWDGTLKDHPLEYRLQGTKTGEWFIIDADLTCEISKADAIQFD